MSQNYLLFLIILFIVYSNTDAQNQSSVVRNVVMTSKFPNERFVATFESPATPGGEIRQYRIYLVRRFGRPVCDATFIMKCSNCSDTTVGSAGGTLPSNCSNIVNGSFSMNDTTIRITSGDPSIPSATVYDVKFEAGNAWGWGTLLQVKLTSGHYKSEVVQNYNFTIINKTTKSFYTTFQVPINENGKSAGYILRVTPSNDINKCVYGRFYNCTDCSGYTIGYEESLDMNCSGYYKVVDIKESNKTVEYQDNLPFQLEPMNYTATVYAQNGYGWGDPDNAPIYIIPITLSNTSLPVTSPTPGPTITTDTLNPTIIVSNTTNNSTSTITGTSHVTPSPDITPATITNPASITSSYLSNLTFNTFSRKISFDGLYGNCSISYINIVLQGSECIYMVLNLSNRCNISSSNPIGQTIIPTNCTQVSVSVSYSGLSSYVYVPSSFNCAWPSYTLQLQDYILKWSNPITTYTVGGVFILIIIIFVVTIAIVVTVVLIKYKKYMSDFLKSNKVVLHKQ